MSTTISDMPAINSEGMTGQHLLIIEAVEDGFSIETQHTTLEDLYNWLNLSVERTFNINSQQIVTSGINLTKAFSPENNVITLNYSVPNWENGISYPKDTLIIYNNSLYVNLIDKNTTEPNNDNSWERLGYKIGKHLSVSEDNVLSGLGIDIWAPNMNYQINDFVIYNKRLYQCIFENNDTTWMPEHWQNIGEGNGIIKYENQKTYETDSIVIYNDRLYKRKETGTDIVWDSNNWVCISSIGTHQVYIKYSTEIPKSNSDMKDTPDDYIGIYSGFSEIAPTRYTDYNWYKIRGDAGEINIDTNSFVKFVEVNVENWNNVTPYTQNIDVSEIRENMYPVVDIALSDNTTTWENELKSYSCISQIVAHNKSITLTCVNQKPSTTFSIKLRINGDVNADNYVTRAEFNELNNTIQNINSILENILGGY